MGHIFCLMGKSSSGKDSIYKKIIEDKSLGLEKIIPGTTRPIREGEKDGREYYFYKPEELEELSKAGKIIERRDYNTVHGIWSYFTVADDRIDPSKNNYLIISTLEGYMGLLKYYGSDIMVPLYIEVEDGKRLMRALNREMLEDEPKYAELCRRFLADSEDFSEEKLAEAGISTRYINDDFDETVSNIIRGIHGQFTSK